MLTVIEHKCNFDNYFDNFTSARNPSLPIFSRDRSDSFHLY